MIFIRKIENIKYVLNNYGKCTVHQPLASFVIQFSAANIAWCRPVLRRRCGRTAWARSTWP